MQGRRTVVSVVLGLVLLAVMLGGCTTQGDGIGASTEGSGTAAGTQKTETAAGTKADEPPVKLRFFYGDSGLPHPEGVNPSDNRFLNIIERLANVDLEVEVPGYQDFENKFNLLMASGQLPDLVHTYHLATATKSGDDGAFIDLKELYDNSPAIQKVVSPEMMELAKSPSGHYYRIPMAYDKIPQGRGLIVRKDLIDKYNGGVFPDSIEGYAELLRKIKRENPDAIPMSNRVVGSEAISYGGDSFYNMIGAGPYRDRVEDGVVISNFVTPEYRYVTELMRQLYSEGVLDQEFATNDGDRWRQLWQAESHDTLFMHDSAAEFAGHIAVSPFVPGVVNPQNRYMLAPPITKFPDAVQDVRYTESFMRVMISDHGLYIPSTTSNREAAWRTIEALASDELYEALWYGFEGEQYTTVNGKMELDFDKLSDPAFRWSHHLNFIFGWWGGPEVTEAKNMKLLGEDYGKEVYDSLQPLAAQAEKNGIFALDLTNNNISDEAKTKLPEIMDYISKATIEAIMSRISMEEFDAKVAEFQRQYASVYDEKTKAYADAKDELGPKGVKILDF